MKIQRSVWLPPLAIVVLGLALLLPRLGASGLWDPWEPKYALTAHEMAERGDWVVPYYREDPRLNRPPMTYWLIGMSQRLLGPGEAADRLPSALLAILCPVVLAWTFALRARPWEGFLAGAALLSSPQWLLLGRSATLSAPLASSLGAVLAIGLAAPAIEQRRGRRILFLACVVLLAFAALTNFPRGLLLPAWAVLGWGAITSRWRGWAALAVVGAVYHAGQLLHNPVLIVVSFALVAVAALFVLATRAGLSPGTILAGSALLVVLVAPWFLALYRIDPGPLKLFNYKYALNLGESAGRHTGPYLEVPILLLVGALPWAASAVAGLAVALRRGGDALARVPAGALVGGLAFFMLSEARMGHFYVVLQPAIAALAGIGLVALLRGRRREAVVPAIVLAVTAWLVFDEPSLILESATVKRSLGGLALTAPALTALGLCASLFLVAWARRREAWIVACVLPPVVFAGALGIWAVPELEYRKSLAPVWRQYVANRQAQEPLGLYGASRASAFYYSKNRIVRLDDRNELNRFLAGEGAKFLIVSKRAFKKLGVSEDARWETLDRTHPTHLLVRFERPR